MLKLKPKKKEEKVEEKKYNNLKEVMDYSRGCTMFYSGVEYEVYLDGCYNMGVRNFLMSYEYLKGKGHSCIKKYEDMHLFIDSGAFTYQNDPKYLEYTVEQWEEQIETYLKWAERHSKSIFAMAELDLQNLLGEDIIWEWRKKYFEPFMLKTGIPVCFIYHHEGMETWERMCQRYPYVGFSAVADDGKNYDYDGYREMLRVAEKHGAICHGFGMTRTSLLPKLPFYTVDSTSWKSGFRYGQIAIWNGQKVQMFKKEDFDTKVFPVFDSYRDIKINKDLIRDYNEPEVLRANVYAYQKAEDFINMRLKPLLYWQKREIVKRDITNLEEDFYPSPEWFDSDQSDYLEYARKFNINPELPKDDLLNLISDIATLLNWENEKYEERVENIYTEEVIEEIHDVFINQIRGSLEERIEDLQKFYKECIEGKSDKLLHLGTNFDRTVKEREEYITEPSYLEEDVPEEEVLRVIESQQHLLPEGEAPDLEALDKIIKEGTGVSIVRDEKGKIQKGVSLRRIQKKIYSDKFPKFACDTCYSAQKCAEYKAGYACAFNEMFSRFDSRDMSDIIDGMNGMVNHNMARMQRAMMMEVMNGGVSDPQVTQFINQNMQLLNQLKQMYEFAGSTTLKQTRIVKSDGTEYSETHIQNPQEGGLLEQLFAKMSNKNEDIKNDSVENVVDVEEVDKEKKDDED